MFNDYNSTFIHDRKENPPESIEPMRESINQLPERFYYCAAESLETWRNGKPKCKTWASIDRSRVCILTAK